MNSRDYLEALGAALAKTVPARERMDILRYYKEYFEEAGPEREQEIIADLGDPEELAKRIIQEGGYGGGPEQEAQDQSQAQATAPPPQTGGKKKLPTWPFVLAGVVLVLAVLSAVPRLIWGFVRDRVIEPTIGSSHAVYEEAPSTPQAVSGTRGTGEFGEISVNIGLGDVTIQGGDAFNVSTSEPENRPLGLEYSINGGVLEVWSSFDDFDDFGDLKNLTDGVTITVPTYICLTYINAYTGMGDVTLVSVSAEEIEAGTGMGSVTAHEALGVNEMSLHTGMGDVYLEGDLALETDLETGMGDVTVSTTCSARECHYELNSGMGEVRVDGKSCGRETESGESGCRYELDAESGMGDVRVDFAG